MVNDRDVLARLHAMSDDAQRLLREDSRWSIHPDGGVQIHLVAQRADVDAAHELAATLSELFDLPFNEAARVDDECWDEGSCLPDDGMTLVELRDSR